MTGVLKQRDGERGNALFLILIAVALFAALSYAVTQSGRGGGSVNKEQALILASQATQFPAAVRTGVTRMIITGTAVTALDFAEATTGADDEVFDAAGGGVIWQDPPANTQTAASDWNYLSAVHATDGWYVWNLGTNTTTTGRDVLAVMNSVTDAVCQQINRGLGLTATPVAEDTAVDFTAPGGNGAPAAAGSDFTFDSNPTAPFACVDNGGTNVYYHALVEQ